MGLGGTWITYAIGCITGISQSGTRDRYRCDGHVYYDNRLIGKVSQWFVSVLVKKVDIFPLR